MIALGDRIGPSYGVIVKALHRANDVAFRRRRMALGKRSS
jgi:hypothetical protein